MLGLASSGYRPIVWLATFEAAEACDWLPSIAYYLAANRQRDG